MCIYIHISMSNRLDVRLVMKPASVPSLDRPMHMQKDKIVLFAKKPCISLNVLLLQHGSNIVQGAKHD